MARHRRGGGNRCRYDGKATFTSHKRASHQALRLPERGRVYYCAYAGGWHITRLEAAEYDRRRGRTYDGDGELGSQAAAPSTGRAAAMTYPDVGNKGPSVPAGGTDRSDAVGPVIQGVDGIEVPRAVFHGGDGYVVHGDMTADSSNGPPTSDPDGDDGLPDVPRYEGPTVADQEPLVNPSAGTQGAPGGGVNPMGPAVAPGDLGPVSDRVVFPDTTQDIYPR